VRGRLTLAGLLALAALVAVATAERRLQATFEALSHFEESPAGTQEPDLFDGAQGEGAGTLSGATARWRDELDRSDGGGGTPAGRWRAVNGQYLRQLGLTLLLVVPVGAALSLAAYVLAAATEWAEREGWGGAARLLVASFEAPPYILWSIPFLMLALWLRRDLTWFEAPYGVYLVVVFLGFGAFVVSMFFRQCREQIRLCRPLLDSEALTGIGEVRLFARLFRLQITRSVLPRQWLYGAVFVMLFDFSFCVVDPPVHERSMPLTVFAQGYFHRLQADDVLRTYGPDREVRAIADLERLADCETLGPALSQGTRALVARPYLAFDSRLTSALAEELERALADCGEETRGLVERALVSIRLSAVDQDALLFGELSRFYAWLNWCLVFVPFGALFVLFDARALQDA